jgi:hypothetical protein
MRLRFVRLDHGCCASGPRSPGAACVLAVGTTIETTARTTTPARSSVPVPNLTVRSLLKERRPTLTELPSPLLLLAIFEGSGETALRELVQP